MSNEELLQEMVDIIVSGIHLKLVSANSSMKSNDDRSIFEDDDLRKFGRLGFYAWGRAENGVDYGFSVDCPVINSEGIPATIKEFVRKSDGYLKDCLAGRRPIKYKTHEELKDAIAKLE